ncbi:MAG: ABC transporter permease [Bacteroidetes bacterium]|nr:ABC transporter permease [Bacteroidota bacterium]
MSKVKESDWDLIITPKRPFWDFRFRELWDYRDLVMVFVRRDFVAVYKQTILGPLWYLLQPLMITFIYVFIFGNVAKLSTDGLPQVLFYMSGIILWGYFAACLNKTSTTFIDNANIFGKVYFPRMAVPVAIVFSSFNSFLVQLLFFLGFYFYYLLTLDILHPNLAILVFPVLILIMGMLGLGSGVIISALTTKYRDLRFLVAFGVQLMMFATPVIYPLSSVPEKYRVYLLANPMTAVIETFRYGFLGNGDFHWQYLVYSGLFALLLFLSGGLIFNRIERNFMDTV